MDALELLSGDAQTFREKVWASRVHLHHTDPDALVGLLVARRRRPPAHEHARFAPLRCASPRTARCCPRRAFTRQRTLAGAP